MQGGGHGWFVDFYGISTTMGYLMPNPVHTYITYFFFLFFFFFFLLKKLTFKNVLIYLTYRWDPNKYYHSRSEWRGHCKS